MAKRIQQMKKKPKAVYLKKNGSVSGTKALAKTAIYPKGFASAIFHEWLSCQRWKAVLMHCELWNAHVRQV